MGEAEYREIGVSCGQCDLFSPMGTKACSECGSSLQLFGEEAGGATTQAGATEPWKDDAAKRGHGSAPEAGDSKADHDAGPRRHESLGVLSAIREAFDEDELGTARLVSREDAQGRPRSEPPSDAAKAKTNVERTYKRAPSREEFYRASLKDASRKISRSKSGEIRPFSGAGSGPASELSEEELMEQAKYYVCTSCMTPVPSGHKFCGRCGGPVPEEILALQTKFFSEMQNPEKARLILIRGEGMDGLSYHLKAEQHIIGRTGQLEFPDDPFISPKHANFFYRDNKLVVRDEGSLNGVYIRVRGGVELAPGDTFLAGEQLFKIDPTPTPSDGADPSGTFFYSSPKHPTTFKLSQILEGGALGMTVCARSSSLQIGRENGDLNFPADAYLSGKHCTVEENNGKYTLTDHDSRNGTYVRIKTERELTHGDYLFVGRKLLRVELNVN